MSAGDKLCSILELVRTHFAACGGEEFLPFTRLNFLSENFGGQEFGKAAPASTRRLGEAGEPRRCLPVVNAERCTSGTIFPTPTLVEGRGSPILYIRFRSYKIGTSFSLSRSQPKVVLLGFGGKSLSFSKT